MVDGTAGGFIFYNAWQYAALAPGTGTTSSPSQPNVIATGTRAQELEGQPAFLPINSTVKCFDMQSIRNACVLNTEVAGSVATTCIVQISARSAVTGLTAVMQAVYNPGLTGAPFNTTTFPALGFACINRVDIALISHPVTTSGPVVGVVFDNFMYVAHVQA